jgi:hypothetical protein
MSAKIVKSPWWDRYYRWADTILSVVAGVVMWLFTKDHVIGLSTILNGDRSSLYGTFASIFGALLGFVITSFSIIVGFMSNDRMDPIRKTPTGMAIFGVYIWGSIWVGLATIVPLIGLVCDRQGPSTTQAKPWLCGMITAATIAGGCALYRCVRILSGAARLIMSPPPTGPGA